MLQQSLINTARTSGEAIANAFVNAFEAHTKQPTAEQLITLEADATAFFEAQTPAWNDPDVISVWREAMSYTLVRRIQEFQRPIGNPERNWSGPFGIR